MRKRELDVFGVERDLDAAPEFTRHRPLLQRLGLDEALHDEGRIAELVQPQNLQIVGDHPSIFGVGPQFAPGTSQYFEHVVQIFAVRYTDVQHRARPAVGHVGDRVDVPVGNHVQRSGQVTQHGRAKGEPLHQARLAAGLDDVTHPDLVLHQHKESGEEVFYQTLGPETDREARDAGTEEGETGGVG